MASLKTVNCIACYGTGKTFDHISVGGAMRKLRLKAKLSQAEVARRMGFSSAYVCDLEAGSRCWTEAKIALYKKVCE